MGYPASPYEVIDVLAGVFKNRRTQRFLRAKCVRLQPNRENHGFSQITETLMEFNKEFDASGLSCPLPIVKTKKALTDMTSGQVLRVISTDPGSVCDMAAFAEQTGNTLLEQGSENSKFVFYLKKA
jgi:tRNA 2-thiouridine synthesizing protein A